MMSYIWVVTLSALVSVIYASQNTHEATIYFLGFEKVFTQGIWGAILFSSGCVLMWLFSVPALLELRLKYRKQIRERDKKIMSLEEERNALLLAFRNSGRDLPSDSLEPFDSPHEDRPRLYEGEGVKM